MDLKTIFAAMMVLALLGCVSPQPMQTGATTDFVPSGDMNGRGIYAIKNFTNISLSNTTCTSGYVLTSDALGVRCIITPAGVETDPIYTAQNGTIIRGSNTSWVSSTMGNTTIARIGNCTAGQFVQNTTTGGVQCATPAGGASGGITTVQAANASMIVQNGTVSNFSVNMTFVAANIPADCLSGATFPTSPTTGQCFVLNLTNRQVQMTYDGSTWKPLFGLDDITLFVNVTSGVDNQTNGDTASSPFKTISYALDQIPPITNGNDVINIANGLYNESTITIQNKGFTGAYTIALQGQNLTEYMSGTCNFTNGGAATAPSPSTIKTSGNFTGLDLRGYFVAINGTGQKYVIAENNADNLTIAENTLTVSGSGWTYKIYSPPNVNITTNGTSSTASFSLAIGALQSGVLLNNLNVRYGMAPTFSTGFGAVYTATNSHFQTANRANGMALAGRGIFSSCYAVAGYASMYGGTINSGGTVNWQSSVMFLNNTSIQGFRIANGGQLSANGIGMIIGTSTTDVGVNLLGGTITAYNMYIKNTGAAMQADGGTVMTYQQPAYVTCVNTTSCVTKPLTTYNSSIDIMSGVQRGTIYYNDSTSSLVIARTANSTFENGTLSIKNNILQFVMNGTGVSFELINLGGTGGAGFRFNDTTSNSVFNIKAIGSGGFKITDVNNAKDVIQMVNNATTNSIYIAKDNMSFGVPVIFNQTINPLNSSMYQYWNSTCWIVVTATGRMELC